MACGRSGIQVDRVIASTLGVQPCQSLVTMGLCYRRLWRSTVTRCWCHPVDAAATGSCAERWRFSAEEFISARRSALDELELEAQEASWFRVEGIREARRVDLHPGCLQRTVCHTGKSNSMSASPNSPSIRRHPVGSAIRILPEVF